MSSTHVEGKEQHATTQAWNVSENDFPRKASLPDQMRFLLKYAVLAPSGHNSQPWLFKIAKDDAIELYADRSRALPVVDPDDRELTISCGAALYHLRLAANHFGMADEVEVLPDKNNPDLVGKITLKHDDQIKSKLTQNDARLFDAITKRRSNRSPFENKKLSDDLVASLRTNAGVHHSWLEIIDDALKKNSLADLISQGDKIQFSDKRFRRELAAWLHPNRGASRDGMPGYAHGIGDLMSHAGPVLIRTFDVGKGQAAKDKQLATGSPVLTVLGTEVDEPLNWVQAGQALARILLQARAENVWTSFMNQPIEVSELRLKVREVLGRSGGFPQLLMRMGYGKDVEPTPRRDVDQVLSK